MSWRIEYSAKAKEDLDDIIGYIMYVLCMPTTAKKMLITIMGEIDDLAFMPERFPLYPHEPWFSQKIRFFPVKNYNVLYYEDVNTRIINIVRIFYAGRDISTQFEESF